MPNDMSNFTLPDSGSASGGQGRRWDPNTQQWVVVPNGGTATPATVTSDPRRYGGHGESVDENGNPIAGTSGAAQDIGYYSNLANGGPKTAPQIDRTADNETRGYQMGSLDILRGAADGSTLSPAAKLGYAQGKAATDATTSMAASVRGGPMARAAAARAATMGNAQTLARSNLAAAGAQAGAMATARGMYGNAATGVRAEDLGVATDQAKLEAGHRAAEDQRKQHYDRVGFDVANAENNANLNVSAQDAAAANAARSAKMQADAATRANVATGANMVTGGVMGGVTGYAASHPPQQNPDPDPYSKAVSGSDERMKYGIGLVSHLKNATAKVFQHARDARDKYVPSQRATDDDLPALHAGIETRMSEDAKDAPRYGYFAEEDGGSAPLKLSKADKGYAASRAGQPGYMFGEHAPDGPMTEHQREVMTSDDHAKQAAFELGVKQGVSLAGGDNAGMSGPRGKVGESAGGKAAVQKYGRVPPAEKPKDEEPTGNPLQRGFDATVAGFDKGVDKAADYIYGPAPAPPKVRQPGAIIREEPGPVALSDSDTKYGTHEAGSMAEANRSMTPRVYKYKEGFAEHEGQTSDEENVGPIAQDMAHDPVAATAIVKDPESGLLGIDKDKGLKLVMGSVADLQAQVDALGGMKKKRKAS